mmetsp:Transcript_29878/g.78703  ORF Transcript_29878/g.78703 Transcript_29878/m.78703 type:complete len:204 (-) Transcript_29878:258-869(-)
MTCATAFWQMRTVCVVLWLAQCVCATMLSSTEVTRRCNVYAATCMHAIARRDWPVMWVQTMDPLAVSPTDKATPSTTSRRLMAQTEGTRDKLPDAQSLWACALAYCTDPKVPTMCARESTQDKTCMDTLDVPGFTAKTRGGVMFCPGCAKLFATSINSAERRRTWSSSALEELAYIALMWTAKLCSTGANLVTSEALPPTSAV